MDPFGQFDAVTGLSGQLEDMLRQMSLQTRPSVQHVHALLAYADQAAVREQFDKRFGAGSADAIIAKARTHDGMQKVSEAIGAMGQQMQSAVADLSAKVASMGAQIEAMTQAFPDTPGAIKTEMAGLPRAIAAALPKAEATRVDMSGLERAITQLSADIKDLKTLSTAKRMLVLDMNGDPIGIKIGD